MAGQSSVCLLEILSEVSVFGSQLKRQVSMGRKKTNCLKVETINISQPV